MAINQGELPFKSPLLPSDYDLPLHRGSAYEVDSGLDVRGDPECFRGAFFAEAVRCGGFAADVEEPEGPVRSRMDDFERSRRGDVLDGDGFRNGRSAERRGACVRGARVCRGVCPHKREVVGVYPLGGCSGLRNAEFNLSARDLYSFDFFCVHCGIAEFSAAVMSFPPNPFAYKLHFDWPPELFTHTLSLYVPLGTLRA